MKKPALLPAHTAENVYYFNSYKPDAAFDFGFDLKTFLPPVPTAETPIIFLCIGTDRSTGDSLGPLIGYKLAKLCFPGTVIYGTLGNPVHALNLRKVCSHIQNTYRSPYIVAIDASLGSRNHIGYITLSTAPLQPGLGVKKNLPKVGDLAITGIVNQAKSGDSYMLQSTRLSTVMNMADCIVKGIRMALLTM